MDKSLHLESNRIYSQPPFFFFFYSKAFASCLPIIKIVPA